MARLLQYVFNGISSGAVYSLLALSLVIVFRGNRQLNFAQGEMAMLAAFLAWWYSGPLPIWPAVAAAAATSFCLGGLLERLILRPVHRASPVAGIVAAIGLFLGINAIAPFAWRVTNPVAFPTLFPNAPDDFLRLGSATWRYERMGALVVMLVVAALVTLLLRRTKMGLAMAAIASNPESAQLVGIKTGRVLMVSSGLAATVGAVSGALVASINGNVHPAMMFTIFFSAAAAAMLGGFDSIGGAVISGLLLGILENLVAGYQPDLIGRELAFGVSLLIILAVLLIRPSGLFGLQQVDRV